MRRAFTLIELIAVLVILSIVAAAVGIASTAGSIASKQSRAMKELTGLVGLARAEAMKLSGEQTARITTPDGALTVHVGERERTWGDVGLVIAGRGRTVAETPRAEVDRLDIVFDGLGRTRDRVIIFDGTESGGGAGGGGGGRGRMWAMEFDPVSGAPRVEIVGGE